MVKGSHKDLTGLKMYRLTFVKFVERVNGHTRWLVRCECGEEVVVNVANVKAGSTKSCGCIRREKIAEINRNRNNKKH